MPLYEYKCVKCGHRFEKIESVTAAATKKCPKCGARAERMASAPAIQFKGSGWYVTDYAGKGSASAPTESSGDGAAAKPADKAAEKPAESKPAAADNSNKGAANRKKK
ncbi:MAG TPA: FmdB family zinc ribbon protein [Candidatus Acidoferrales bacterium]|nr:FmdB family zinc ribbon protein [Candidatus Acidoferrales bacterium]